MRFIFATLMQSVIAGSVWAIARQDKGAFGQGAMIGLVVSPLAFAVGQIGNTNAPRGLRKT